VFDSTVARDQSIREPRFEFIRFSNGVSATLQRPRVEPAATLSASHAVDAVNTVKASSRSAGKSSANERLSTGVLALAGARSRIQRRPAAGTKSVMGPSRSGGSAGGAFDRAGVTRQPQKCREMPRTCGAQSERARQLVVRVVVVVVVVDHRDVTAAIPPSSFQFLTGL